ncbi:phosphate ABC transporter permease PstA [Desulfurivibrio alkaliphilus]|uniref:Phosphate transport system permease protein PstA n=1 Tax=Desulfurivibrio alkaliphilus (strain DSM 19089 / UNIQEM U267 / AHT2) TaxID=589865 RepID=D6Z3Y5_DESAT|nr:phosphate ABC transporter permease PstA [Desulfurivibrio alkaliphilus]ADH86260.1 phosphate ABC transporter, inner membrane subunit PstA [Desulfurivibrio alkaliphilus AHT 2]
MHETLLDNPAAQPISLRRRYFRDHLVRVLLAAATCLVLVPLGIVISYVVIQGVGALNWDFFTQELGSPARAQLGQPTGLVHTIIGTLVVDSLALLLAVPLGIGAGIMLAEYPDHRLNPLLRLLNDTLNGMPAILKGLLAFALIVKPMGTFSGIAGAVALGFVMLPIIARATESALSIIPWSIREAGLALGLPRWRVVLSAIIPAAKVGLVTGVLIAFARAVGEAAPLLFTSFGNNYLPGRWTGWLLGPVDTLPQRLYSLAISPYKQWHEMGWAAGIVLLGLVIFAFIVARLAVRGKR